MEAHLTVGISACKLQNLLRPTHLKVQNNIR